MRRAVIFLTALGGLVRQSLGERIAIAAIFVSVLVVGLGLGALVGIVSRGVRALAAMLGLAVVLMSPGCAVPCRCICAPAPDPRVRELAAEVDRQVAEVSRLRERLRFEGEVEREQGAAPVWIFPKIQPEGGK